MAEERVELVRGRHVLLRLTEDGDAQKIVEWRNRPETARWLNQSKPLTVENHLRWYREARLRGDLLLVFETLDREPIGCTSIFDFDHLGTSAEWGRLVSAHVGGGCVRMLEACYLLHRLCFDGLGFFRLHGRVWADNERAWRIYQFLGWVQEGRRRKHALSQDGYHDVFVISAFAEEFQAARKVVEVKIYGSETPPEIPEAEARRLRKIVGAVIHRPLDAP